VRKEKLVGQVALKPQSRNRGFTLIEIMVVVAILGLLAVVVVPQVFRQLERAQTTKVGTDIRAIEGALKTYRIDANLKGCKPYWWRRRTFGIGMGHILMKQAFLLTHGIQITGMRTQALTVKRSRCFLLVPIMPKAVMVRMQISVAGTLNNDVYCGYFA